MIYRKFVPDDALLCLKLLQRCFPQQNITQESFTWKYLNNFTYGFVAHADAEIISVVFYSLREIERAGEVISMWQCSIIATDPMFRKQGHSSALQTFASKALQLHKQELFGFSNQAGVLVDKNSTHHGYTVVGRLQTLIVISLPYSSSIKLRACSSFNRLLERKYWHQYWSTSHLAAYMHWRYESHPKYKYQYLEIIQSGKSIGYVIIKPYLLYNSVQEILLPDATHLRAVLKALRHYTFKQAKLYCILTVLRNPDGVHCSNLFGFWKPSNHWLTVFHSDKTNPNDWQLCTGDIL